MDNYVYGFNGHISFSYQLEACYNVLGWYIHVINVTNILEVYQAQDVIYQRTYPHTFTLTLHWNTVSIHHALENGSFPSTGSFCLLLSTCMFSSSYKSLPHWFRLSSAEYVSQNILPHAITPLNMFSQNVFLLPSHYSSGSILFPTETTLPNQGRINHSGGPMLILHEGPLSYWTWNDGDAVKTCCNKAGSICSAAQICCQCTLLTTLHLGTLSKVVSNVWVYCQHTVSVKI